MFEFEGKITHAGSIYTSNVLECVLLMNMLFSISSGIDIKVVSYYMDNIDIVTQRSHYRECTKCTLCPVTGSFTTATATGSFCTGIV